MPKSKIFKKKKGDAPAELPDLAVDELKKDLDEAVANPTAEVPEKKPIAEESTAEVPANEQKPTLDTPPAEEAAVQAPAEETPPAVEEAPATEEVVEEVVEEAPATEEVVEEVVEEEVSENDLDPEKSYFNNIMKDLDPEQIDVEKLNDWYKQKFPKGDALGDMKEYWEEKKDELILESIGKDYKDKIATNMAALQKLEGEWQKIYFELITKEEAMKNQEKKLRSIIKEFTEVVKKRGGSTKKEEPSEKKTKKTTKKSKH